jgi:hypothetical protein
VLNKLPTDLASDGHLLKLFTPDTDTRKVFNIALGLLAGKSWPDRIWKIVKGVAFVSPFFFLVTLLVVATLPTLAFSLVRPYGIQGVLGLFVRHYLVCAVVGLLTGVIAALIASMVLGGRKAIDAIVNNGFGLISGMAAAEQAASLTTWIHQQIQAAAGLDSHATPLTFGDLWSAKGLSRRNSSHGEGDQSASSHNRSEPRPAFFDSVPHRRTLLRQNGMGKTISPRCAAVSYRKGSGL